MSRLFSVAFGAASVAEEAPDPKRLACRSKRSTLREMRADQEFSSLLYISDLSLTAPHDAIASIANRSRHRNLADEITGLLAFDGSRFVQLVEGPLDAITRLLQRLRADKRHSAMEILALRAVSRLRFPGWSLAYTSLDPKNLGIHSLRGLKSLAALEVFDTILPTLTVAHQTGLPVPGIAG